MIEQEIGMIQNTLEEAGGPVGSNNASVSEISQYHEDTLEVNSIFSQGFSALKIKVDSMEKSFQLAANNW